MTNGMSGERADLTQAMRAELQELETGRLAWAVGCTATIVRWRARTDWLFLIVLPVIAMEASQITFWPILHMGRVNPAVLSQLFHYWSLAGPALLCAALAAYRPAYWRVTALSVPVVDQIHGY